MEMVEAHVVAGRAYLEIAVPLESFGELRPRDAR